jgi:hypothetical protein
MWISNGGFYFTKKKYTIFKPSYTFCILAKKQITTTTPAHKKTLIPPPNKNQNK